MNLAKRDDAKETAANYEAQSALREVSAGNRSRARNDANSALELSQSRDVKAIAASGLAAGWRHVHSQ